MIRLPDISKVVKIKLVYHKSIIRAICLLQPHGMAMKMPLGFTKLVLATLQGSVNSIINFVMIQWPYIPNFKSIFHPNDYKETHEVH